MLWFLSKCICESVYDSDANTGEDVDVNPKNLWILAVEIYHPSTSQQVKYYLIVKPKCLVANNSGVHNCQSQMHTYVGVFNKMRQKTKQKIYSLFMPTK